MTGGTAFSRAVKHVSPVEGIDWIFETFFGFQNLNNMMSKEGGSNTQSGEGLFFYGILYHAYYEKMPFIKAQLNMGFDQHTHIYWSENPDFNHEDPKLNEHMRCIEVDVQYQMPALISYYGRFFPFIGYTFLNYSSADVYSNTQSVQFNALTIGAEYSARINKMFSHSIYLSYAPIMVSDSGRKAYKYFSHGAEFIINSHPVALTAFFSVRNGIERTKNFFDNSTYAFYNTELGFSFYMNLR